MPTVYDWSPLLNAINGQTSQWGQRNQVNSMIDGLSGKQPAPNTGFPAQDQRMTAGQTTQGPNALAGINPQILQMLRNAPPQVSMPLLLQLGTRQNEYDTGDHVGINPATGKREKYVTNKATGQPQFTGVAPSDKLEAVNGQFVNPYTATPGQVIPKQEATPDIIQIAQNLYPNDPAKQQAYIKQNSPANLRAITNINMENRRASAAFTEDEGALMGALAERGVSLPTGFRSKEQQKTMYEGILRRNPDKTPDEIADLIKKGSIELGAQKKETQTAAAVAGRVVVFQNEIEEFAPLVREALAKVPRGNFVPLNRLMQMADTSISDPNLKVLKGRINALLNAYDGLASRGGTDVDKRAQARALLTSADGPEAANAQLDSFLAEAAAAHRAAVKATKVPELDSAPAAAPAPAAPKVRVYNPKTGKLE